MPEQKLKLFSQEREPAAIKIMQRMSRIQAWVFKKSGGRLMRTFFFMSPVGILTSKGRKSGQWREACLLYGQVDGKVILIASKAGCAGHPAWYYNLCANPHCTMQIGRKPVAMLAREAHGEEKDYFWGKMMEVYQGFDDYQERASAVSGRVIPLIVLEPAST
ncbi:nitroreductase/quinone reductase family protein [Litorivivens sp.]|uniref:nitroreductase/quinone reductase family protein n=1 Tax=Litorivivens sp. TaxID=2020868 RepID=UPI0035644B73